MRFFSPSVTASPCHLPHQREALGGIQHVFDENAISGAWIVDKDMGHRTNKFAVLDNQRAGHELYQQGTTIFYSCAFTASIASVKRTDSFSFDDDMIYLVLHLICTFFARKLRSF